jgi:hypothetical protein
MRCIFALLSMTFMIFSTSFMSTAKENQSTWIAGKPRVSQEWVEKRIAADMTDPRILTCDAGTGACGSPCKKNERPCYHKDGSANTCVDDSACPH